MISILIPTKNHASYLRGLIDGLLALEPLPIERILICNDASTDSTSEILSLYSNNIKIEVYTNTHSIGGKASIDLMLEAIRTPYFILLASDDFIHPEISILFDLMIRKRAVFGSSKYNIFSQANQRFEVLNHPGWSARLLDGATDFATLFAFDHYMFLGSSIFSRTLLDRGSSLFDNSLDEVVVGDPYGEFRSHDWDLALSISWRYRDSIVFHEAICGTWRRVEKQLSSPENFIVNGRAAYEMSILILKHLRNPEKFKAICDSPFGLSGVRRLLNSKLSLVGSGGLANLNPHYSRVIRSAIEIIK